MLVLAALVATLSAEPTAPAHPASSAASTPGPRAAELFERDWLLRDWALRLYDGDKDVVLSDDEAANAAQEFKRIADGNADGRVTPDEFRRAREFILARY